MSNNIKKISSKTTKNLWYKRKNNNSLNCDVIVNGDILANNKTSKILLPSIAYEENNNDSGIRLVFTLNNNSVIKKYFLDFFVLIMRVVSLHPFFLYSPNMLD